MGERSFGRGAVVGERSLGYPDADAHTLGVILTEILGSLK
ncbi:dihydroxyacetone kinase, ATP-dependent [Bacillus cereus]